MRKIVHSSTFIRDLKRASKKRRNIQRLTFIVQHLQEYGHLPSKYKPHKLSGNWKSYWECHIESDFLLIYRATARELLLVRLGSHDDLF